MSIKVMPLIEGDLLPSTSEQSTDVINPSTGQKIFSLPIGSVEDVNKAVQSARTAFEDGRWQSLLPSKKKSVLYQFADLVKENAVELDRLDAEEMGKPVGLAMAGAAAGSELLRFNAEALDKISANVFTSDNASFISERLVPRGVIGAITPWNFPVHSALVKAAPALAMGNSLVLKPSEFSSRSSIRLAQLALESGIPPGVFNIVPGLGHTVGKAIGLHNDVNMIAFTGSGAVGKLMQQYAGQSNMKVVMAECGGKSPQIVFSDGVDLNAAAESIANMIMLNSGQICVAGSRLLVQDSIEQVLIEKVSERMSDYIAGDALANETTLGPLVSSKQYTRVKNYIDTGLKQGGELVLGGGQLLPESGGNFIEPTIIKNVPPESILGQEEVFGPVLSVMSFKDESEAIQIANSTPYGLAAYVWTADLARGMRMASSIPSYIAINACAPIGEGAGHALSSEPMGQSGVGVEGGMIGMQSFCRRQLVCVNHGVILDVGSNNRG